MNTAPAPEVGHGTRPVRPWALAAAGAFAVALFATIYAHVRNEYAIVELQQSLQFASPRSRMLRAELATLIAHRPLYWTGMAASFAGIGGALALGTLRRRA